MKGNLSEFNEQFLPVGTRQNYNLTPYQRDKAAWEARARAEKERNKSRLDYTGGAGAVLLTDRASLKLTHLETDADGYAAVPARKATSNNASKQPACLLCGKDGGREQVAFGKRVLVHDSCLLSLQRSLQQPDRTNKSVQKALTTPVASGTDYTESDKEDARLLVRALAQLLRGE